MDSELIESLEDCLRREKRAFLWIGIWLGGFVATLVAFPVLGFLFRLWIGARYRAGQSWFYFYQLWSLLSWVDLLAGVLCAVAFFASLYRWVEAMRRRRFSYAVLHGDFR